MGTKYHKIDSIFKRDQKTGRFLDEYTCPEFDLLSKIKWTWTEKIDGTNIRITWAAGEDFPSRLIGGRTDNAQIPADLVARLEELFPIEELEKVFGIPEQTVVLYGEGVGPKIQKGGGRYRAEPDFILFDVRIGHWWMTRENVKNIADVFGLVVAPDVGHGTLEEAVEFTKAGFTSRVALDPTLPAEGLVLRPKFELFKRNGERIITKVKTKDFKHE